jgi:hypothetical protein
VNDLSPYHRDRIRRQCDLGWWVNPTASTEQATGSMINLGYVALRLDQTCDQTRHRGKLSYLPNIADRPRIAHLAGEESPATTLTMAGCVGALRSSRPR